MRNHPFTHRVPSATEAMTANYMYMEPSELVALLDDEVQRNKVAVIDCRDEDRSDGFILGSIHFPSRLQSEGRFNELADTLEREGRSIAVFHCALSQVRGPKAANRFAVKLYEKGMCALSVYVLRGGWDRFHAMYGESRPDLTS
ncbi:As/Sb Reductase [Trypanosoma cruzi]|nr:As/Sb Reductase [Trypanosoma cruzi]